MTWLDWLETMLSAKQKAVLKIYNYQQGIFLVRNHIHPHPIHTPLTCIPSTKDALRQDDVMKWKYLPRYWPFVRGIHRWPVGAPQKDQWCGALKFSLICAWTNDWTTNWYAGDLRRRRGHCDVTVIFQVKQYNFHLFIANVQRDQYWYILNKIVIRNTWKKYTDENALENTRKYSSSFSRGPWVNTEVSKCSTTHGNVHDSQILCLPMIWQYRVTMPYFNIRCLLTSIGNPQRDFLY